MEPEQRLVARQLEREWEEKLATQQRLQEEYGRFVLSQPQALSATERETIRHLATDLPALWAAASSGQMRQR